MTDQAAHATVSLCVTSQYTPDTGFVTVIEYGPDVAFAVGAEQATRYARALVTAAMSADYDAALCRQVIQGMRLSEADAADMVGALRGHRGAVDADALGPLSVDPRVSAETGAPFLWCTAGTLVWRWEPAEAREHAVSVLAGAAGARLNNDYHQLLIAGDHLGSLAAAEVVCDLALWFVRPVA